MSSYLFKLKTKLRACYRILFGKYNHWVIFNLPKKDLNNLLSGDSYSLDITYHGIRPYIYKKIVKDYADNIDSIEFLCDKAQFEADSIDYENNKK